VSSGKKKRRPRYTKRRKQCDHRQTEIGAMQPETPRNAACHQKKEEVRKNSPQHLRTEGHTANTGSLDFRPPGQ